MVNASDSRASRLSSRSLPQLRAGATLIGLVLSSQPGWAQDVRLPAPVIELSWYVMAIFVISAALFVFFRKSTDKKKASLTSILEQGRRSISSVHPDASVTESIRQMNDEQIGALLVMEDGKLMGIFTERDALTKVLASGMDPVNTKISEVMTKDPYCVDPATTIEEAMSIVSSRRIRHLPIVHNGELVGMVSSGDLTHCLIEDQAQDIRELVDIAASK